MIYMGLAVKPLRHKVTKDHEDNVQSVATVKIFQTILCVP
jgi:hypothetical protein